MNQRNYIGRFAPSPTGPLHYGSLLAAVASYLQAKHNRGKWLVRIEDIDPPREVKGSANEILRCLDRYEFEYDEAPLYQSSRFETYRNEIDSLNKKKLIYACSCSRKEIETKAKKNNYVTTSLGVHYSGTCRNKALDITNHDFNIRVRSEDKTTSFIDRIFGKQNCNLSKEIGDFVIYRKLNLPTYALAVTIDDYFQGITEVVRGSDLLNFTPVQIYLCQLLQLPTPNFMHIPIITNNKGDKLSKQTGATPIPNTNQSQILAQTLRDLGQKLPRELANEPLRNIWSWAIGNWKPEKIPKQQTLQETNNVYT